MTGDEGGVDTLLRQRGQQRVAPGVGADAADEPHGGALAGRGHGLVQALAAKGLQPVAGEHRLASFWQPVDQQGDVGVEAPDDDDTTSHLSLANHARTPERKRSASTAVATAHRDGETLRSASSTSRRSGSSPAQAS